MIGRPIDRRVLLARTAALLGASISSAVVRAVLAGETTTLTDVREGAFPAAEKRLVTMMSDLIIPETDTPGALTTGVPDFIERMVANWLPTSEQIAFSEGLRGIDVTAQQQYGQRFIDLDRESQLKQLTDLDQNSIRPFYPPGWPMPFFAQFKELTVVGFFTSEAGATIALNYNPAPGRYDSCVELKPGDRAWFYRAFG